MSTVLLPMKRVVEPPPVEVLRLEVAPPEGVLPGVRPPPAAFALAEGVDEAAAAGGVALPGVLALADGVGEAAVVADDASLPAALPGESAAGAAAAAVPARDGSPQPATIASRVADTALANARRHRWRGCAAGIAELSFDHVSRSDDLQWSGNPERLPTAPRKSVTPTVEASPS